MLKDEEEESGIQSLGDQHKNLEKLQRMTSEDRDEDMMDSECNFPCAY